MNTEKGEETVKNKVIVATAAFMTALIAISMLSVSVSAMYLPSMPPGTGIFGTAIAASPTFADGYHWDDPATPEDERERFRHTTLCLVQCLDTLLVTLLIGIGYG